MTSNNIQRQTYIFVRFAAVLRKKLSSTRLTSSLNVRDFQDSWEVHNDIHMVYKPYVKPLERDRVYF